MWGRVGGPRLATMVVMVRFGLLAPVIVALATGCFAGIGGPTGFADAGVDEDGAPEVDGSGSFNGAPDGSVGSPDAAGPVPGCGNGTPDPGEECDDGNHDNQDACLDNCHAATCGDGEVWTGHEECDDGDTSSGDGCDSSCVVEYCGDDIVQPGIGEECESGVQSCTTSCDTTGQKSCQSCEWGSCQPPTDTCNAADDDCDGTIDTTSCLNTVYRFYNPTTGDHMFKVDDTSPDPGYVSEAGNNWKVYASQVSGTWALYQVSNGTDHMLSSSSTEGSAVGYSLDRTIGYVGSPGIFSAAGLTPSVLCRYYNPDNGDHFTYVDGSFTGYNKEACAAAVWDFH